MTTATTSAAATAPAPAETPAPEPRFTGPELCRLSAHEAVGLLRRGEIAPAELIAAAMTRIDQVEPEVNALPTTCQARAEAAAASLAGDPAHPGWLAGLPLAIKDLSEVAGVRATFGTRGMTAHVPETSSPIVTRIEARGGVVLAKSNTPEFGAGANTFNDVFGYTRNPWDTTRNAGGSSGGAAAALATGEVWLAHGSDLAGSLRTPAAYCGVVGLRPSPGRVPGAPAHSRFNMEAVQGPMARSVLDCALFLDAMAGEMRGEPLSQPAPATPFQDAVTRAEGRIRIAFAPDLGGFAPVSAAMEDHLRQALARVVAQGAVIDETCPPLPDLDPCYRTLRAMLWAAGPGRAAPRVQRHFKRSLQANIDQGRALDIEDVLDAQQARSRLYDIVQGFMAGFDVLACPVVGLMPGPVEEEYPREIDGQPLEDYIGWLRFSFLAPVTGLPAISVPVGRGPGGLPVGLQLIGQPRGEAALLAAARAVERACGGPLGPIDPMTPAR
ncbi:amidase [Pseudooceanicola sp. 200-1SW]|uniref:amidase n=1 Tax=Pseudooceanicola sp. 200-1SW TaxID=3425949 RepID=UPI003D7FAF18